MKLYLFIACVLLLSINSCHKDISYTNLSSSRGLNQEMQHLKAALDAHEKAESHDGLYVMQSSVLHDDQGSIKSIYQVLLSKELMDVAQARVCVVEKVQDLIKHLKNQGIEQDLKPRHFELMILFEDQRGSRVQQAGLLAKLILRDSMLHYYEQGLNPVQHFERAAFYRRAKEDENLYLVEEEFFDEASERVEQQSYLSNFFNETDN